jgi:hypothetical protein
MSNRRNSKKGVLIARNIDNQNEIVIIKVDSDFTSYKKINENIKKEYLNKFHPYDN